MTHYEFESQQTFNLDSVVSLGEGLKSLSLMVCERGHVVAFVYYSYLFVI